MSKGSKKTSRREFLYGAAGTVAAFTVVPRHVLGGRAGAAPSEKLNIAIIGVGGRGGASVGAGGVRIFPETKMKEYETPEPTIPRVRGHHQDWLNAIKTGGKAGSNFDYGGPLTEIARLGIIAMQRLGEKLEWDGKNMRFTNSAEANELVNPPSRKGWEL